MRTICLASSPCTTCWWSSGSGDWAARAGMAADPTPGAQNFLTTFALIFAVIAALFVADTFLAGVQRRAGRAEAEARYREGEAYLAKGDAGRAIDRLKAATAIERTNSRYALALGDALLRSGKGQEAAAVLNPVLERDPDDGAASLAMARVLRTAGRPEDAISFYHRAIFGH